MATVTDAPTKAQTYREYVESIVSTDPKTALDLALAETDRQRFALQRAQEELRSKAEVELDEHGRLIAHNLAGLMAIGRMYAESGMVPEHYRDKPGACAIAEQMARRCKVDTFLFMQNTYPVGNKIGMEAKLAIAMLNSSGKIRGRIRWSPIEGTGKDRKCTAYATDATTGEIIEETVTWAMVEAEGWNKSKGTQSSKWMTLPDLMFKYRSAVFLCRVNYPDVLMGMHTSDELEDVQAADITIRKSVRSLDDVTEMLNDSHGKDVTESESSEDSQSENTAGKSDTEPTEPEKPRGLEGVKEMMMAVTDSQKTINDIARGIRKDRILTADEEFQLDEMAELHKERIRGKSEG